MNPPSTAPSQRYEIHITSTAKSYRPEDEYRMIDQRKLIVETIDDVREQLLELYGNCKRVPMYIDGINREPEQIGWVYCFNNDETIRGELQKWRQQDWVQVMKLMGEVIDPRLLKR